ncbi:MAG: sulfite oxidase [Chloroflexi bacterium]|nr:sulfite oxidase [Chloroflexota bacterium]
MQRSTISRRTFLAQGGTALAGLAWLNSPLAARAFALQDGDIVLPWLDQRIGDPPPERVANQQTWEKLDSWITPNDQFFSIAHYNRPEIDAENWRLWIGGLVSEQMILTLDEIKALPRRDIVFTLECSGNNGRPVVDSIIGNATWTGTPLAALLERAGVLENGREVVFFGTDAGEEVVREQTIVQNFARSMSLEDAMHPDNLLVYEMNGEPLPQPNGYPLRLIAPGWFGIANIKWLDRIEVWDTRLTNRWMARDYVTLRNEGTEDEPIWTESSVSRILLKSAPGRVIRNNGRYRIEGAAWGAPIAAVEVRIDDGDWHPAQLDTSQQAEYAWTFWSLDWPDAQPGQHSITSRAIDTAGNVQPAKEHPIIANKVTYWESNGQLTRQVNIDG